MEAVRGHRRGVDEPLHAGVASRAEHVQRPIDVDGADRLGVGVARDHEGEVDNDIAAREGLS
jgi:hypothetical protein